MTDRAMIFNAPMVRALIEGRKTQTRRMLKPQPGGDVLQYGWSLRKGATWKTKDQEGSIAWWAGERLWVRESFSFREAIYSNRDLRSDGLPRPWYWADGRIADGDCSRPKPSIHMPRWASRITLTVTDVRVERLQQISDAGAIAEGVGPFANSQTIDCDTESPRRVYSGLWNSLHGEGAFDANPWVAAISFSVDLRNIDAMDVAA